MQECDAQTVGTFTWSLVDEADAFAVAHGESFAYAVFNLESNVVNATTAVIEELLYGALRASGFQEFQLYFAHFQEGASTTSVL